MVTPGTISDLMTIVVVAGLTAVACELIAIVVAVVVLVQVIRDKRRADHPSDPPSRSTVP